MQRALSFDASPRLSVPLRFLLTAPLFALVAASLLFWLGPDVLSSRWGGGTLALTHLLVLGCLSCVMCGALMQILPVATGVHVAAIRLSAGVVHIGLVAGVLFLASAFLLVHPRLFVFATIFLAGSLVWMVTATAWGLWTHRKHISKGAPTILLAVRLAIIALFITFALGARLALSMAGLLPLSTDFSNLHVSWGLMGWVGLLIIGISFQVIPMFQVTELFPRYITRWLALLIFLLLLAFSINTLIRSHLQSEAGIIIISALLAAYLVYAATTFELLQGRKRPKPDTTTWFWRIALASIGLCFPAWLIYVSGLADTSVLLGILLIVGFAWSAINGMLYKIIPFLLWYNVQRDLRVALPIVPKVKHFLPDNQARPQVYIHCLALLLLCMASIWPHWFTHAAAIAFGISTLWLIMNIRQGLLLYYRATKEIQHTLKQQDIENVF